MKYLLIILSIAGFVLLVYQFVPLLNERKFVQISASDIKGFAPGVQVDTTWETEKFDRAFAAKWDENKAVVSKNDGDAFITHLILIILTALSTLLSTIGANKAADTGKKYLIYVAIVTFFATVTGGVETRFNNLKNDGVTRQQALLKLNNDFTKDWNSADTPAKKDAVQNTYIRNLNL